MALLETGRLSETDRGPAVAELEAAFGDMTGVQYALSFNSGTAALHAGLHAALHRDFEPGHQDVPPPRGPREARSRPRRDVAGVVVTPMTWISALTAIFHAGSFPVFCDVEHGSPVMSPSDLDGVLEAGRTDGSQCGAVLVTHAWGIPASMAQLTRPGGPPVIEDCSHAHGALYVGRPVGSWGVAGCFSLQESKAVSAGEGGVLTTGQRAVYELAMTVGHHPHRLANELTDPRLLALSAAGASYKHRMPALAAVIARHELLSLTERNAAAEANWQVLRDRVERQGLPIAFPPINAGSRRGWYGTPLLLQDRHNTVALHTACLDAEIPVRSQYPDWLATPLLRDRTLLARYWPHIADTPYQPIAREQLPNYDQLRRRLLILKIPDVPAEDYMRRVCRALAAVLLRTSTRT